MVYWSTASADYSPTSAASSGRLEFAFFVGPPHGAECNGQSYQSSGHTNPVTGLIPISVGYVRTWGDSHLIQADKIVSPERTILDVKLQEANQLADKPDRRDLLAAADTNHHLAERTREMI